MYCLRDRDGQPYRNNRAGGRAIGGGGGVFRKLRPDEVSRLFHHLQWDLAGIE